MPKREYSEEPYADLMGDRVDPDLSRLMQGLAALSAEHQPDARVVLSVGETIQQRASQIDSRKTAATGRLRRRFWIVPALALAALALLGAGYAVIPVIEQAFNMDAGTARIVTDNLGTVINRSQTIDGFTLTVKRVYVDVNQVVVGYTVSGPRRQKFNTFMVWGDKSGSLPTLTSPPGVQLSVVGGLYGTGVQGGRYGQVLRYTSPQGFEKAKRVTLEFDAGKITAVKDVDGHKVHTVAVRGKFHFVFRVPVTSGRVTYVDQTAVGKGVAVTLERVAATRLGTRVTLKGGGVHDTAFLLVDGSRYPLSSSGSDPEGKPTAGTRTYVSSAYLENKRGTWTLVVKSGQGNAGFLWTFRFTMSE
ncbi:MAG: DUF4179 domain-containing protein [Chloroflexota bacterium]